MRFHADPLPIKEACDHYNLPELKRLLNPRNVNYALDWRAALMPLIMSYAVQRLGQRIVLFGSYRLEATP